MAGVDENEVINEFFSGAPRASEWQSLREALADRRRGLRRQRDGEADPVQQAALDAQIAALARQLKTLKTEEVVARFVEDSIKATLARAPDDLTGEDD